MGVSVVPAWFCLVPIAGTQVLSPTSIVHKNGIKSRLPVGVNSPRYIVVELEVDKLEM